MEPLRILYIKEEQMELFLFSYLKTTLMKPEIIQLDKNECNQMLEINMRHFIYSNRHKAHGPPYVLFTLQKWWHQRRTEKQQNGETWT